MSPGARCVRCSAIFAAGKVACFTFQSHKRQAELRYCRGANAETGVGAAAGDGCGDGQMSKFFVLIAAYVDGAEFFSLSRRSNSVRVPEPRWRLTKRAPERASSASVWIFVSRPCAQHQSLFALRKFDQANGPVRGAHQGIAQTMLRGFVARYMKACDAALPSPAPSRHSSLP
jgi:hypothetical protein